MRVAGTALVFVLAGCSVNTLVAGADASAVVSADGSTVDARALTDGRATEHVDSPAGTEDAGWPSEPDGATDAGATVTDAGTPDAGRPACDDLYGGSSTYALCEERGTECELFEVIASTCGDFCSRRGGSCVGGWTNLDDADSRCVRVDDIGCDVSQNDTICICSR